MADKTLKAYHFDFGWIGSLIVVGYSLEVAKANAIVLINENKEKEKRWFLGYHDALVLMLNGYISNELSELQISEIPCVEGNYLFKEDH